jgi:hypothetical protein
MIIINWLRLKGGKKVEFQGIRDLLRNSTNMSDL